MASKKESEQSEIGRQLYLAEVHPGKVTGFFREEHLLQRDEDFTLDPEEGLAIMHHKIKGEKLRKKDLDRWWKGKLKEWGYTQANQKRRIEELHQQAVRRLKDVGVWDIILRRDFTLEERETIHRILTDYKPPIRDPDSSEGFTIYPDESSWRRDLYGDSEF